MACMSAMVAASIIIVGLPPIAPTGNRNRRAVFVSMIYKYRSASVALVFPAQLTTVNSAKRILGTCNGSIGSMQVLKEQVLDNIYHDQSDVVLLRVRGRLPSANFAEQFVCKLRRCAHLAAKNNLFELSATEWFAFGIFAGPFPQR